MTRTKKNTSPASTPSFEIIQTPTGEAIKFRPGSLWDYLYAVLNQTDENIFDEFGYTVPSIALADQFNRLKNVPHTEMPPLKLYLQNLQEKVLLLYRQRIETGHLSMTDIPRYFPVGSKVVAKSARAGLIGGIVKSVVFRQSFYGNYYEINLSVIHAIKGIPEEGVYSAYVGFEGSTPITNLSVQHMTKDHEELLTERGKRFTTFYQPGTYLSYKGTVSQLSYWSTRTFRGDGRVVVDPISFERLQPDIWKSGTNALGVQLSDNHNNRKVVGTDNTMFKQEELWRCLPFLYGFSLAVKQWGLLNIEGLSEVKWRDDAFDQLVLEQENKELIHSLVKYHGTGFTDIIDGKGGGCIFLLHGEPGFGKTSSAEAIAELLHKPLYSVSVGELGVDPEGLETSLRNILDVATIWNAVILLDEADIFLEKRDEHNIARNAMVGVFLRLLEYHNGILFLTTNRVKEFDKAFYSRISVALHYTRSDDKIGKIWNNLLLAAGLPAEWGKEVADQALNGRQIKNSIRMSQTLAKAKDREVQVEDLIRSVKASLAFENTIKDQE